MHTDPQRRHAERLQRVLDHVERNLDADLGVEALAKVAAFSPHHFHRWFSASFGMGVGRYVRTLRLKRAGARLAFRDASVLQIAMNCGYEGPEAFSRAFKQQLDQTPGEFRKAPDWRAWRTIFDPVAKMRTGHMTQTFTDKAVRIVEFPDTPVAVLRHRGDPAGIGGSVRRFIAWRKSAGLPPRLSATFNVWHDDPMETPPEAFRLDICAAAAGVSPNDDGVTADVIAGGRCAVLRHVGSDDGLRAAADFLYGGWLPRSGEEPADRPPFAQRVRFFPDVAEHEAVTDVFLPLR
jgi:AraC family transcriptional regulator